MIFDGQERLVLSGRKSEHWYPQEKAHVPWRTGRSYAVQVRMGGPALGHVKVLAAIGAHLGGSPSEGSAKRCGHESVQAFVDWWVEHHGAWVAKDGVWVVVFQLDLDRHRLLAADSSRGYVTDPKLAMRHEPEAVDQETQARITAEASRGIANRKATMRSRIAQIREQGNRAIREGKDPTPHLDAALDRLKES